ncbi:hypothetical protein ASG49_04845 [Marmoricola sp. Leaf446]|nr:hypothetical protein ASG49_04845 [Marmoricola sp. Leaf446]
MRPERSTTSWVVRAPTYSTDVTWPGAPRRPVVAARRSSCGRSITSRPSPAPAGGSRGSGPSSQRTWPSTTVAGTNVASPRKVATKRLTGRS